MNFQRPFSFLSAFILLALPNTYGNPVEHDASTRDGFHQITSSGHHASKNPGQPFNHGPNDIEAGWRMGVTPGYYLGFRGVADELRNLRRPLDNPASESFFKSFFLDIHYMNQEFNGHFFNGQVDSSAYDEPIENDLYGLTFGFGLGGNPNLQVRIPISVSRFEVGELDDNGLVAGLELFPNFRINEYLAWGINLGYTESTSDFPIFDESMTKISFETMAESSAAYGINWSGRFSLGRYFPSNDANDDAFWLSKGALALHFILHDKFTMLPFLRFNYSTGDVLTDDLWWDFGNEFIFMPKSPWSFSFGIAGVGGHDVIEEGMEFYFSTKGNF